MLKNVEKCWMLRILPKMLKCWKMLIRKLIFSTQIILFFDKEFKKIIINPYFYQHLFSSLLMMVYGLGRNLVVRTSSAVFWLTIYSEFTQYLIIILVPTVVTPQVDLLLTNITPYSATVHWDYPNNGSCHYLFEYCTNSNQCNSKNITSGIFNIFLFFL